MPWFALLVPPQCESRAKRWLARQDVFSFYPVIEETRLRLGRQVNCERRVIPGYLFADFKQVPAWYWLLTSDFVTGVLRRMNGEPGMLAPSTLETLINMRSRAEMLKRKQERAMAIRRGDRVRIRDGAYQGYTTEVVEVDGIFGKVKLTLLGDREVSMELERMEKVA